MFTTVMYGFINEVTRQPASAEIPLVATRRARQRHSLTRSGHKSRQAAKPSQRQVKLPGTYRVFADSFKRAAGFN
ncbi:MAG: hypothetical protein GWP69_10025 [Gammaproteobacteria bacterium]|jgi:hypothetical protein|nr:hypothetical protein [Gammaproteobacteria bacterium]